MLVIFENADGVAQHVLVEFSPHQPSGGWRVVRCDNKRALGWLTRGVAPRQWRAHVYKSAFRTLPEGLGSTGVIDAVPGHLAPTLDGEHSRHDAVKLLVAWLQDHRAPVLGFPAHPEVQPRGRDLD